MATVRPFRGLRPESELAAKIASLPYDVMDTEEVFNSNQIGSHAARRYRPLQ